MPETTTAGLTAMQMKELKDFGSRVGMLGANFAACDYSGAAIVLCKSGAFDSDLARLAKVAYDCLRHPPANKSQLDPHTPVSRYLAVPLVPLSGNGKKNGLAAIIDTGLKQDNQNTELTELFAEILRLFAEKFIEQQKNAAQMDMISSELAQTYEELVLLYKISTNMEIVEPDANFLQMACDNLTEIVSVEGIAILQEKSQGEHSHLTLVAGAGVIDIDERMALILGSRLREEMNRGKEALLDSEVDAPFRYEWSKNIRNIIVVPLCRPDKAGSNNIKKADAADRIIGILVAINRLDKPDFDSTDVKLFTSVANECAVFIENNRLFNDLKELFIGSLKALARTIDAKDRYTRGHSERVAFISKWIAEQLAQTEPIDQEQIHRIYIAGLLHDIGKIGIDEKVLCKNGKLTDQERTQLRTHPLIGANILGGIKQMKEVIPGVLHHHERIDGKGYPNGLKGDEIPLMGKIVGLADCFDAMTSDRVYHEAQNIDDALAEIEKRLGTQFDEKIGKVFLKSDVYHLWDLMQDGVNSGYGSDDYTQYGAVAVGTLIK